MDNLKEGGCAAVILNTVKRAQCLAAEIRQQFPDKHVLLLHSRYIPEDRIEYEKELLTCAGKKSTKADRDGFIVIGTQVIEQSLDFDVDFMITDLCPMDFFLQRIGRLHRHPAHDEIRPDLLKQAKCYVLGTGENLDEGSKAVYESYLLMRTKALLPEIITLPADISTLVQRVYDDTYHMQEEPEGYPEARDEYRRKRIKACKDADAFRLLPPGKEKTINRFLEAAIFADEEHAKAQVRNGDITIEIILIYSTEGGLSRAPWRYKDQFSSFVCPSAGACRSISNQKVNFPSWVTGVISIMDMAMPDEWEKSVWLRGKHLIILDEYGKAEIDNLIIQYDRSFGLVVKRRDKS